MRNLVTPLELFSLFRLLRIYQSTGRIPSKSYPCSQMSSFCRTGPFWPLYSGKSTAPRTLRVSHAKIACRYLIWDEICRRGGQDEAYLNALGLVLMRTVARSLLNERASIDNKVGLSKAARHQIEAYLNQNFHKPLSVPDMAALLGISAGHFSTCFRKSFGQTPHQYLMELRLDEAERCLRKTSMPINEIAHHLNFSSQSHLTTALRKHRQTTPGELRK